MSIFNLLLVTVLVGLTNNTQVSVTDPQFFGFIETRDGRTFLRYQQDKLHGEMPVENIARIDFGYRRGQPFPLTLTLRDGRKLEVQSEYKNYVKLRGVTAVGEVWISHPDPVTVPLRLMSRAPNREDDLTIQFLEFGP